MEPVLFLSVGQIKMQEKLYCTGHEMPVEFSPFGGCTYIYIHISEITRILC